MPRIRIPLCLNFHPLEVASRYRDPQLQVDENYSAYLVLWIHIVSYSAMQRQKAISAYFTSKQILPFGVARQY